MSARTERREDTTRPTRPLAQRPAHTRAAWRWRYPAALVAILTLGLAWRLWNLARDVPTLNSDEAIVGLMALHMLHGEWTTFYWAQDYMGSLEAVLAAPLIRLLGPTSLALRLPPLLTGIGFIALVYRLGALLYSRAVGLVSALLLALATPFFMTMSVRAFGGYTETLALGSASLLLALRGASPTRRRWLWAGLAGGVAGLALWTDPLVAPYLLVAALIYTMRRRRDLLRWPNGAALAAGLLAGASPAIVYNIAKPAATIAQMIGVSALGGGPRLTPALIVQRLVSTLTVSLPIIAGAPFAGVQEMGLTALDFQRLAAGRLVSYAISLALLALAALALASTAARLIRRWRALFGWNADKQSASAMRLQGQLALLVLGACYLAGFLFTRDPAVYAAPRYLLPLYTLTPLVIGEAWLWLRRSRVARRLARTPRARLSVAALGLAVLLAWNVAGVVGVTPAMTAGIEHGQRVPGQNAALLSTLTARHVHTVITSSYWIGYTLCYESGEAVIPVMSGPDGRMGYNRYPSYVARGLRDPAPAYIELAATPQAALLTERINTGAFPGYALLMVGNEVVALPPAPSSPNL